ncbi:sensor histidine kinase N-terminal domain-containing protein [Pseudogemmobacter sp. W21_MBD1_M6]|uniref:sensor histidine kinase N-terminal domain-containing protein n=1 Tax=Pseudogemmobacter sp. W21_MBD1_M6 TaxID=3240271 RepID=UPI003F98C23F
MTAQLTVTGSLRRRLVLQLLVVAAVLSVLLYSTVRGIADRTAETVQDNVLGSATIAIAEQLRADGSAISVEIPYAAFSMLGSFGQDRVFYRITQGADTITGYPDLALPDAGANRVEPVFYTTPFRDYSVRVAAVERRVFLNGISVAVQVLVAQTRLGQQAIAERAANTAAALGIGFFVLALMLSLIASQSALRPLAVLAEAMGRRGPDDLRPLRHPAPQELAPLVGALNGLMARLQGALQRTETFIAEAAHHVRTPLATVRAQAEIALRRAETEESRKTLRAVIRAVEESSRSAGQLLDHATVTYRSDQLAAEDMDVKSILGRVVQGLSPTADLKDLRMIEDLGHGPLMVRGDGVLIESALRNLVDNAIKYSPADSDIHIGAHADAGQIAITIRDAGRGLNGARPDRLTRRFQRGTNVGDVVGSGLGLTIVEQVARAHGGRFELTQNESGGTCARLLLPQL